MTHQFRESNNSKKANSQHYTRKGKEERKEKKNNTPNKIRRHSSRMISEKLSSKNRSIQNDWGEAFD